MPYEWLPPTPDGDRLRLWPHRSLPRRGFVWFVGGTALLIGLPLLSVLGSPVLWGLLPFLLLTIAAIWWALERSYRDGEIVEDLTLGPDRINLIRRGPRGMRKDWQANPHWVRVIRHETGGPVPQYLTLHGGPREVEIGAFLSEDERLALAQDLSARLRALR
ncbi:DUF2244 domain-containing protein [Gemmobacter fulvus]|uniref:DUF2244 domain-containing protein n=1 Tax=Gemmobacter fulvus TaxID=2840474 RepID=A0A975P675_9RHOB|nr:DUF2244 domain-containing protein [Gemmobacter fulvus]MBT9247431.1 DUF2244 domain-containing protein [Gemmobacter fulvus]MDQ1848475.1 DUF2244 domain-containing protein [Gemmobacter fulvus]QWK90092.1 DUF2244 domain-containing protein [Gemmobacter fulvus]